ncbi:MAG: methyltransferase domain-containing protein [Dissulfurispiraceae bacterium]|jgi:ubiquinone/menaquinone biosynthesis C-methylase UbiE|nr:methyltransferase domain-containing protein [Dissulfurispiraceae bacterium]
MKDNEIVLGVTVGEIAAAFADYKAKHGKQPDPDTALQFPINLQQIGLDQLIKNYQFSSYDSQAYNKAFIELVSRGNSHNSSFIYDTSIFTRYKRPLSQYMNRMPESTLQIGPGGSLGCEVLMCMSSVKEAFTIDPFPLMTFDIDNYMNSLGSLFNTVKLFEGINGFSASTLQIPDYKTVEKGIYKIGSSTIKHIYPRMFEDTGFADESVDYLFSHATLEHVRSPLKCVQETHRVLKPGGLTAHCIDLRDHRNFDTPLGFLKESDASWSAMMEEYCKHDASGYMNRWRSSEFVSAFEKTGFKVLEVNPEMKISDDILDSELPHLDNKFKTYKREDLGVITVFIVAQKI